MDKNKSFIRGAAILGIAGLICKLIGALYRIPLYNYIGAEAMGIYYKAYPIYAFLLVLSTTGVPTAISKLVAERTAVGDYRGGHRAFKAAFYLLLGLGSLTTLFMLAFAPIIATGLGISGGTQVIIAIAPSLLIVSLLSAYRGYFQGMQNMTPTAVTQIVEQVFKLIVGFTLAIMWSKKGPMYAAAGALLGITIAELITFVLMLITFQRARHTIAEEIRKSPRITQSSTSVMRKRLLILAIPITIGGAIMPLVDSIDAIIVTALMKGMNYSEAQINSLYGVLKGMVNSVIHLPAVLTIALAISLVPAISNSITLGDYSQVKKVSSTGLKLTLLIGLPSFLGLFIMARQILELLFGYQDTESLVLGTSLMHIMSFAILFLSLVQTTTGILQGLGKIMIPIRNLTIGVIVKLVLNFVLIPNPSINIKGAPIGTVACYAIAAILNIFAVVKYSGISLSIKDMFLRPIAAAISMAAAIYLLTLFMPAHSRLSTLIIIAIAAIVYFIALIVFKAFTQDDIDLFPGGGRLGKLLNKLRIIIKNEKEERECNYEPPINRNRERL